VLLSARPRVDARGAFAGLVGSVADSDEPVAESAGETLPASFTQGLDRALRAPLARIVANADSIHAQADGPITPGYTDYAADIASAGRHLLSLVDDLVDLQAIERAEFRPMIEPIDLADVARRAAGLLTVRADMAGVTINRPRFDDTVPALGDFRRALQILVNLIGNAVRYTDSGGDVRVEATLVHDRAKVTVIDAGKGIALEDQSRIFDKFERIDPTEPGGNGLGLFIARRLARAMGGDLTVASVPGQGARFTLTLPAEG
jgi:signal transduction histidine kinase